MTTRLVAMAGLAMYVGLASAQVVLFTLPPVKSRELAGVVEDPSGTAIAGAEVSLIDCPVGRRYPSPANRILTSVRTDRDGNFRIRSNEFPKPYCIRLSSQGFNPVEFQVILSHLAASMHVKMHVAT